jgi:uncharacterized protein YukE
MIHMNSSTRMMHGVAGLALLLAGLVITTMALEPKTCMDGICAVCPSECNDIQIGRFSQQVMDNGTFDWVRDACICLGCEGQSCQRLNNGTLRSAVENVGDALEQTFDEAKEKVPDALETAYNATKEGLETAKEKTKQGLETAKETIPGALETAFNATKQGLETAANATKNGLETAAEKTKEGLETAGEAVSNAFNTVFG